MTKPLQIADALIGPGHPCWIVAEVGINHNGSIDTALKLIDVAHRTGCDAVKFQKRTPEVSVPPGRRLRVRQTPWGEMGELAYRRRMELGQKDYAAIDAHCRHLKIPWFASCWDLQAVGFIEQFDPPVYKIASPGLTDDALLWRVRHTGRPVILSTGMSTMREIFRAIMRLRSSGLRIQQSRSHGPAILQCTSAYPCPAADINLRVMEWLRMTFGCPVGFSTHEAGTAATIAAVALGADVVERHITLRRQMLGSDHRFSLEPWDLARLVGDIRHVEKATGDGHKRVCESERRAMEKLRPNAECRMQNAE